MGVCCLSSWKTEAEGGQVETTYASRFPLLEAGSLEIPPLWSRWAFSSQLILEGTLTEVRRLKFRLGKAGQTSLLDLLCGLSLGFW